MARNTVFFEHPHTGVVKRADVGFSLRLLQFGALLPLYHRQWALGLGVLTAQTLTFGISNLVVAVWYNKLYIRFLVSRGYQVTDTETGTIEEVESLIGVVLPRHHFGGHAVPASSAMAAMAADPTLPASPRSAQQLKSHPGKLVHPVNQTSPLFEGRHNDHR